MAAATETCRELARRASNGIEVSLFWSKPTNQVTVELFDARIGEGLQFEVEGSRALEAYNHPYAYAPMSVLDSLDVRASDGGAGRRADTSAGRSHGQSELSCD